MPFDVRDIMGQLEAGAVLGAPTPVWLRESWDDPDGFTATLTTAHVGRGPPLKSRAGQHYDFFHDLVIRHSQTDRVALRTWDRTRGWQALGYRQLHDQAARRATSWAQQGVKPGARVCLLYFPGPELLISLAAALGLGAAITLLQPQGRRFLARRLAALAPDHIAAEPHQVLLFEGFEKKLLQSSAQAPPAFTSHTYKPAEPVGLLFSPVSQPADEPSPLTAGEAWSGALVDGMLTFGLNPGEHLAAPGFPPLQQLPALLFATLLRGATFLHLELSDLETQPALLSAYPLRALGVTPELRDALLHARTSLKNVSFWFRNPEEPLDWQSWRAWVAQCGLADVPHANVLVDAAAGGAVLCSLRRVGDLHPEAPPAPGRRWALRDANLSGQEAPGDVGLLTLLPDKDRPQPYVVLSRLRGQYTYAGTRDPRREGRVYLSAELTSVLQGLPGCAGTAVFTVSTGGTVGHHRQVLLVFTGAEPTDGGPALQEIRRRVELQLGPEHQPDRVVAFPLYPRRAKGQVETAWCVSQYLTGALHHKASDPLFQALTALRGHVLDQEEKPGDDGPAGAS